MPAIELVVELALVPVPVPVPVPVLELVLVPALVLAVGPGRVSEAGLVLVQELELVLVLELVLGPVLARQVELVAVDVVADMRELVVHGLAVVAVGEAGGVVVVLALLMLVLRLLHRGVSFLYRLCGRSSRFRASWGPLWLYIGRERKWDWEWWDWGERKERKMFDSKR